MAIWKSALDNHCSAYFAVLSTVREKRLGDRLAHRIRRSSTGSPAFRHQCASQTHALVQSATVPIFPHAGDASHSFQRIPPFRFGTRYTSRLPMMVSRISDTCWTQDVPNHALVPTLRADGRLLCHSSSWAALRVGTVESLADSGAVLDLGVFRGRPLGLEPGFTGAAPLAFAAAALASEVLRPPRRPSC